jgi:hypothetical protein
VSLEGSVTTLGSKDCWQCISLHLRVDSFVPFVRSSPYAAADIKWQMAICAGDLVIEMLHESSLMAGREQSTGALGIISWM